MDNDWEKLKRQLRAYIEQDVGKLDDYQKGYLDALEWVELAMANIEKAHVE